MVSETHETLLNSVFLKEGRLAFERGDYKTAEKIYREGMEYAFQHENDVGIYLVFRAMNSVGAALSAQGKYNEALNIHRKAEDYLYSKIVNGLEKQLVNLYEIAEFIPRNKAGRLDMMNPYISGKAIVRKGKKSERDYHAFKRFMREDDIMKKIKAPSDDEIEGVLSMFSPDDILDITWGLSDVAYNKGRIIFPDKKQLERYYKVLLRFPLYIETYQTIIEEVVFKLNNQIF